jgi:hypothetical protein
MAPATQHTNSAHLTPHGYSSHGLSLVRKLSLLSAAIGIVSTGTAMLSDVTDYPFSESSPILSGSARRMHKNVKQAISEAQKIQQELEKKAKAAGKTIEQ